MLTQLEARNKSLEAEVVKLQQHIAILNHIVASKKRDSDGPPKVL
jgi:cell division protein FtsB